MLTSAEAKGTDRATAVEPALPDDSLFRVHFESLPGPAYIWRRLAGEFVLVAYNAAAAALRFSRVAGYVGMPVTELQRGSNHDLARDLDVAATRGVVIRREFDYRYIATQ